MRVAAIAVLILFVPGAVAAFDVDVHVETRGVGRIQGLIDAEATATDILALEPGSLEWTWNVSGVRYQIVDYPYIYTNPEAGPLENQTIRNLLPARVLEEGSLTGHIRFDGLATGGFVHAHGARPFDISLEAHGAALPRWDALHSKTPGYVLEPGGNERFPPIGHGVPVAAQAGESVVGNAGFVAWGTNATLIEEDGSEHLLRLVQTYDDAPPNPAFTTRVVHRLVLVGQAGSIALPSTPAATIVVDSLTGRLDGEIELADSFAHGQVNGTDVPRAPDLFHAVGSFQLTAQPRDDHAAWTLAGQSSYVGIDGAALAGSRDAYAVAAGIALLALALLGLKKIGASWLAAIIGRSRTNTRAAILEMLREEPAASFAATARNLGLSRQAVARHAQILTAQGKIHVIGEGRERNMVLNRGTHSFPASTNGAAGPTAAEVLAEIRHPARRALLEALSSHGDEMDIGELLTALGLDESKRRLIAQHADRLRRAGCVSKLQFGRTVRLKALVDLGELQAKRMSLMTRLHTRYAGPGTD